MTKKRIANKRIANKLIFWLAGCLLLGLLLPLSAAAADSSVGVAYRGHIQDFGDYPSDGSWVDSPEIIGTRGQSKRIEGFEIKLTGDIPAGMELRYNVHVQNKGWLYDEDDPADWPKDGAYAGTRGESLRIEAVKIVLTDSVGKPLTSYTVQYRGHVQNVGDLPADKSQWLTDGDQLGTVGSSLRLEALLVQVVKNAVDSVEPMVYDTAGTYGPATGTQTIAGDVKINADGVTLQNLKIEGDLTIAEAVGTGTVTLNNVTVSGDTFVRGGGKNSIHINGGSYSRIVMEKTASGAVRIVAKNVDGLDVVISEDASGETIILEGAFDSVTINAPNMTVTTQGNTTTIGKMTVGEAGAGSTLTLNPGTTVTDLVLDGKAAVKGQGTVVKAEVKADGVVFDKKPGAYTVEPGVVIPPVFPTDSGGGSGGGYYPSAPIAVSGVSLNKTAVILSFNANETLVATVAPADATNKAVTWTTSDGTIATVDATGKVIGSATKEGTATITAMSADGTQSANCTVTVTSFKLKIAGDGTGIIAGINGSSTDIVIPETIGGLTITAIGDMAFQNSDIEKVTIPKTVKTIGLSAFENCPKLSTVTFAPDSLLEAIGDSAFYLDHNITKVTIPKTVKIIGADAFSGCYKMSEVTFAPDSSLETLGAAAFASIGTTSLTLPANLKSIGDRAFFGCARLETISIPAGVTAIPVKAFAGCGGLSSVTLPSGLTAIGAEAFKNCSNLTAITIPKGVVTINADAFGFDVDKAPTSRSYTFRGDVPTTMGAEAGTVNPGAVIPVTASPTIRYYGNYTGFTAAAWNGYTVKEVVLTKPNLTSLQIVNHGIPFVTVNWNTVVGTTGYDVFVSNTSGTYGVVKASVASGVTATSITGLDSSKTYYFFVKAKDAYGESLPSNEQMADLNIAVTGVTVSPAPVTLIVGTSTTLTATVAPANAANKAVTWTSSNEAVATVSSGTVTAKTAGTATITATSAADGSIFNTCSVTVKPVIETTGTTTEVTITKYNGTATTVDIPAKIGEVPVTAIGANAFSGKTTVKTVTIPATVSSIGANAFELSGITSVTIPAAVTSIGQKAFCDCDQLATVTFEPSTTLTTIGASTFQGCDTLAAITLPPSVTTLGELAFLQCPALTSINLDYVTSIGANAFNQCNGFTDLTIPNNVTQISGQAFVNCKSLKTVHFDGGDKDQTLAGNTFGGCTALENVTFAPDSKITNTGWGLFNGCSKLNSVTLPPKLTVIGVNAFINCYALGSVDIPATVTAIETCAFQSNTALTSVTIPANVTSIGESAFQNCTKLATVSFAGGSQLTAIGKNGFYDCPITSLALPAGLVTIGDKSFCHNRLTSSLSIPAKVTTIGINAFEGDAAATPSLATLNIQSTGPLSIGEMAFSNQPLTSIAIPAGVTINDNVATMGINGTDFKNAYLTNGAGTYQFTASWIRTP